MVFGAETYTTLSDIDQAKYNAEVRIKAARQAIHTQLFTPKNTEGESHEAVFTVFDKLDSDPTNNTLSADDDPSITNVSDSQATITAAEYGLRTGRMQATKTGVVKIDEVLRSAVGINAGETLDNAAALGIYNDLTTVADYGTIAGPLTSGRIGMAITDLEDTPAPPFPDGLYAAVISPLTKRDLFGEEGDIKGFIPVTSYARPQDVYNRELGTWLGVRWIIGSSAYHATSVGVRHDYPFICGYNAFGMAMGYPLEIVAKMTDAMNRLLNISWKAQRGYGVITTDYVKQFDVIPSPLVA